MSEPTCFSSSNTSDRNFPARSPPAKGNRISGGQPPIFIFRTGYLIGTSFRALAPHWVPVIPPSEERMILASPPVIGPPVS